MDASKYTRSVSRCGDSFTARKQTTAQLHLFTAKATEGKTDVKKRQTEMNNRETEDRQTHEDTRLTKLLSNSTVT